MTAFRTNRVPAELASELARHGIEFAATPSGNAFGALLSWIVPPLLFVGIWLIVSRAMGGGLGGGMLATGRSKAKLVAETDIKVTFDDVAGVDEAAAELHEIVDFLKRPEEFTRLGARDPARRSAGRSTGHWQDSAGPCHRG